MPVVRMPDGANVRFPDDMPREQIRDLIARKFPDAAPPSTAVDVAKSGGVGLAQGAIGVLGAPGLMADAMQQGTDWLFRKAAGFVTGEEPAPLSSLPGYRPNPLSIDKIQGAVESQTGEFYKPKTTAGEFANTVGQFIPGAIVPGARGVDVLKYGVLPGLASEAAGQATEGTSFEPYARAGAAIATGGGLALASRPSSAQAVLAEASRGIDQQTIAAAQSLMDDAARMGSPITLAEAVQQVTNSGTRLADVQRVVEQSAGGAPAMREFMASRSGGVQQAGKQAIDAVGPVPAAPYTVGPQVQAAANKVLEDTRKGINRVADPYYNALPKQQMPAADYSRISQNPSYQAALRELRGDTELAPLIGGLPDDSLAVVNEVVKRLGTRIEQVSPGPMNPSADPQKTMLRTAAKADADKAARLASQDYGTARDLVEQGREAFLDPLKQGPVGALSQTDDFARQANTVLPSNPLPGSAREIGNSVRVIARENPEAARALVSQKLRQVFNETTQTNMGGPNQWGGAKFNAVIAGNTEQAAVLRETIDALNGPGAFDNFKRTLDVFEAMGRRQAPGSMTEFNKQITEEMKRGGLLGDIASTAASPTKLTARAREVYEQWRYGRNTEQLAALLTRPDAARHLERIAKLGPNNPRAEAIAASLLVNTTNTAQARIAPPSQP